MKVLITGAAGFIGYHLSGKMLESGHQVIGIDNLNDYYDVSLKEARLSRLTAKSGFNFEKIDIADRSAIEALFFRHDFDRVVHLAAQAGVRYSITNPHVYIQSNITGFIHVLEGCRKLSVPHLIFASSSSVYGANTAMPFSVHQNVDHPVSLYAATKKTNELMAHSYSSLYRIPCTGLRFFTVYGPWGRPDMALFTFTRAILEGKPISVFNQGRMRRDFTYIDDIVDGVLGVMDRIPEPDPTWDGSRPDPSKSFAPYRLYNIGNNNPVGLLDFIRVIEKCLGREAEKEFLPLQPGDVPETYADIDDLVRDAGFRPRTSIEEGIPRFVRWYKEYYEIQS